MIDIGRICVKLAGREAGKYCVVVEKIDDNFVLIDGQVRRKRCNILHLEPTEKMLKIKKGASHSEIIEELNKIGIQVQVQEKKPKVKEAKEKKEEKHDKEVVKDKTEKKEENKKTKKKEKKK